jgi:opacity protein-like surface antigen
MRKFVFSLAAAGAALVAASPAAAQYYPQQYGYGGNGYGNSGYSHGNFGDVRALQARIDSIEYRIRMLDRRDVIRDGRADRFREDAKRIENRLHRAARYGLNGYEANDILARIGELEQRVQYASVNRYGRYGRYGHDGYEGDRDGRDGRWDRNRD